MMQRIGGLQQPLPFTLSILSPLTTCRVVEHLKFRIEIGY